MLVKGKDGLDDTQPRVVRKGTLVDLSERLRSFVDLIQGDFRKFGWLSHQFLFLGCAGGDVSRFLWGTDCSRGCVWGGSSLVQVRCVWSSVWVGLVGCFCGWRL
jgi:hypothetical protein